MVGPFSDAFSAPTPGSESETGLKKANFEGLPQHNMSNGKPCMGLCKSAKCHPTSASLTSGSAIGSCWCVCLFAGSSHGMKV